MSPELFSASQIGLMLVFKSSMNALKCPGRMWSRVTRLTGPSVYWSWATPVASSSRERDNNPKTSRTACFIGTASFCDLWSLPYLQHAVKGKLQGQRGFEILRGFPRRYG